MMMESTMELLLSHAPAVVLRVTALLLVGFLLTGLLRHASAALRHWVWVVVCLGAVVMPLVVMAGPVFHLPTLQDAGGVNRERIITPSVAHVRYADASSADTSPSDSLVIQADVPSTAITRAAQSPTASTASAISSQDGSQAAPAAHIPLEAVPLVIWLSGAALILAHGIRQFFALHRLTGRGAVIHDAEWLALCGDITRLLRLRQTVTLVQSDDIRVPMVWGCGLRNSVVLLPPDCADWTPEQHRMALLHELVHVARRDTLVNWLALLTCAAYWFNPLVWIASRRLALEAERATDDQVLGHGINGASYARLLVAAVRSASGLSKPVLAGISMVKHAHLTDRIRAILDARRSYQPLSLTRRWLTAVALMTLVLLFSGLRPAQVYAQNHAISLTIPEPMTPLFRDVILPRFFQANPDIYVELRTVSSALYQDLTLAMSPDDMGDHLDATAQLVNSADVHFVYPFMLSTESTRSGYFLDIAPLTSVDSALPSGDFVPALYDGFSWDGGQWALPALAMPLVMVYDPAAFDAANLSYPTESWTFDDYVNAARTLTAENAPGMQVTTFDLPTFYTLLTGQDFDDDGLPAMPQLDTPELSSFLETWTALEAEGVVTSGFSPDTPLRFARISDLIDPALVGVLVNGGAGADVTGFAISSGTSDPDAAYRLAVFLSTVPELATITPNVLPARYSVQHQYVETEYVLRDAASALRLTALENALTPADLQFNHYLWTALPAINAGEGVSVALQNAQIAATDNLSQADSRREALQVNVPPAALPTMTTGEPVASIKFGLFTGRTDLANRDQWQAAIDAFVDSDPALENIEFTFIAPTQGYWDEIPKQDCVFGYSFTQFTADQLLAIDPLLSADPTFNPDDVVGDVMLDMQMDGATYGIPAAVFPFVLKYDREVFAQAGIPEPDGTWTVNEFIDALTQLKTVTGEPPLFIDLNYSTPWELLMAGFGAPPIDYSTTPPTLNLTDPVVIDAARQAFDLAKSGLVQYQKMATFFGSGSSPSYTPALISDRMSDFGASDARYGLVTFPVGTETTPISFYTSSSFIFSHAPYPEPCYRWLREITRHPELINGMPAYHSVIAAQETQAVYGESGIATFRRFAELMEATNRVYVSRAGLGNGNSMFVGRAFDRYVLEDADLETEMALAQALTETLYTCSEDNPDLIDCLLAADPTIRDHIEARILGNR